MTPRPTIAIRYITDWSLINSPDRLMEALDWICDQIHEICQRVGEYAPSTDECSTILTSLSEHLQSAAERLVSIDDLWAYREEQAEKLRALAAELCSCSTMSISALRLFIIFIRRQAEETANTCLRRM